MRSRRYFSYKNDFLAGYLRADAAAADFAEEEDEGEGDETGKRKIGSRY